MAMVEAGSFDSLVQNGVAPDNAAWAIRSVESGKMNPKNLLNPPRVQFLGDSFKYFKFLTKHELGHEKLVNHYRGFVKEFVIGLRGATKAFVSYIGRFTLWERSVIAAGGEAATGSSWGTVSDRAHISQAAGINKFITFGAVKDTAAAILNPKAAIIDSESETYTYKYMEPALQAA